jgi:N-acetylglucosaminyl-diphospho-decaprenol L-rhamnosyltransferase
MINVPLATRLTEPNTAGINTVKLDMSVEPHGAMRLSENSGPAAITSMGSARVTIAIVTYCSRPELPDCLDSILASGVPSRIVVIDNGSNDGTLGLAEEYAARYPNIVAIASGGNIGLAAGNNLVLPHIQGDYVLILNPDTVLEPHALATLVRAMDDDPKIGAIGPKCVYEDGTPHTSYHYGWGLLHLIIWRVFPYSITRKMYDRYARYREAEVSFVSGACLMARSAVFRQIGGYDPAYFLTVEDAADLCERIRGRGYKVVFTPRAEIKHLCGRSGEHVPYLTTLEGYKGDIYHFLKHGGKWRGSLAFSIIVVACLLKLTVTSLKLVIRRRSIDRQNLQVYWQILPRLISHGPKIAYSTER